MVSRTGSVLVSSMVVSVLSELVVVRKLGGTLACVMKGIKGGVVSGTSTWVLARCCEGGVGSRDMCGGLVGAVLLQPSQPCEGGLHESG